MNKLEKNTKKPLELRYSHSIIEHLGLKLYQNKPTNVIAELISNSWDADAENVWVDLDNNHITICDDGLGMDRNELESNYLIIGKKKRKKDSLTVESQKKRKFMGRKGIGKIAPFGIAKKITLVTKKNNKDSFIWFELDISHLLDNEEQSSQESVTYELKMLADEIPFEQLPFNKNDSTGYIRSSLKKIEKQGTIIVLDNLSLKKTISSKSLMESLGRRFTVTLLDKGFTVFINNEAITEDTALPEFAYREPVTGFESEKITLNGIDRDVRYWVGFVKSPEWPQDQAGVGVYSHGKIAQDRPFVFGLKGREISTRYMYGVVEADWLDELPEDLISTDRTNINWDNEFTEGFYEWGQLLTGKWINNYRKFQKDNQEKHIIDKLSNLPEMPRITQTEREVIKNMVCDMSPKIYKDEALQTEVLQKLTSAWTHRPVHGMIKSLWNELKRSESNESDFLRVLEDIQKYSVPESLSLSVTIAQKIYALSRLNQLSINGTEPQLQLLLEKFPWILGHDKGKVFANTTLKKLAKEAVLNGTLSAHGSDTQKNIIDAQPNNEQTRPDFVFLSDENNNTLIIVELKSPLVPLENDHWMQLITYYYWLKNHYPNANVYGYLVGKNANKLEADTKNLEILTWNDICLSSRKEYLELLAVMIRGVSENYDDVRIKDILDFGGEETVELLKKMSSNNEPLQELFDNIDRELHAKKKK